MLFRRGTAHYLQRLLYMQRARFAVHPHAAVIVHTVGHVGVLLHFSHHNTLADSVQRAGRDKEAIAFFHRHGVQHLGQGIVPDALFQFFPADFMVKAVIQERARFTVQHIPHLGLAVLVFVFQRILVGGVYLNGNVILGVNELGQNGEHFKLFAVCSRRFRVGGQVVRQHGAVRQIAGAIGMAGKHPGFRQRVQIALHAKVSAQAAATPKVILAGWGQF